MYLRTTQRRNKDGSIVRYVQVAHNRKVDGVTHAEVLLNLGREDRLDRDGLTRLVASINRYLGEPATGGLPAEAAHLVGDQLRVAESRPMGTVHLLDGKPVESGHRTPSQIMGSGFVEALPGSSRIVIVRDRAWNPRPPAA